MRYLGGKKRLAKRIAAILDAHRSDGQPFVDVFCGSLAISAAMPDRGPHIANDACVPLINMYKAWRKGWRPPEHVSEELYAKLKATQDPNDPLTAFAGFGLSWGGKWFGGYARGWDVPPNLRWPGYISEEHPNRKARDFTATAQRSLQKCLARVNSELSSFTFDTRPQTPGELIYCDPAYRGTTKYNYFKSFDHDLFEDTAQRWADEGSTVFVSEYAKQRETWEQVAEWSSSLDINRKTTRVERLFRVHPSGAAS